MSLRITRSKSQLLNIVAATAPKNAIDNRTAKSASKITSSFKASKRVRKDIVEENGVKKMKNEEKDNAVKNLDIITQYPMDDAKDRKVNIAAIVSSANAKSLTIVPIQHMKEFKLQNALDHMLNLDPRFKELFSLHECTLFGETNLLDPVDPFNSLCSSIISQQISGAAAKSIKKRFIGLYNDSDVESKRFPTPSEVFATDLGILRSVGLSGRKAEYVHDLAEKFVSGSLNPEDLVHDSDEEVVKKLTEVRGIGVWSAEMFLLFALKRTDIFSIGDLGIQRGMAQWFGRDISKAKGKTGKFKYMSEADMKELSEPYKPYRSLFCWYMWRAGDVIVPIDN
ncbi:DNA glycosylase [Dipodascopsis uninucleata]